MKLRLATVRMLAILMLLAACSSDPMEACLREGMEKKLPPEGSDRAAYIRAREQVRMACERKLK